MPRVILASASEGRRELFTQTFGGDFLVQPMDIAEETRSHLPVSEMVRVLAEEKAGACFARFPKDCVFAFDTMVECEGRVLGKPAGIPEAEKMLLELSGKVQSVWTGYAFRCGSAQESGRARADLILDLSPTEIAAYVRAYPVTRFAGAYAVQKSGTKTRLLSGTMDVVIGACMEQAAAFHRAHALYK